MHLCSKAASCFASGRILSVALIVVAAGGGGHRQNLAGVRLRIMLVRTAAHRARRTKIMRSRADCGAAATT